MPSSAVMVINGWISWKCQGHLDGDISMDDKVRNA